MEENHIACNCEIFNDEEVWANQIMQLFSVSPPLYGEMQGGFDKFFHG
jgi:hypothetical protein